MVQTMVAISVGAALGALLRWGLGLALNASAALMPLGTLAANLIGGFGVGVAVALLAAHPEVPPAWRLFIITGFLGGLTTFSTFSAEVVAQLQAGRVWPALATVSAHLVGSLLMTAAGIASVEAWRRTG
jgi:fluoride exporter